MKSGVLVNVVLASLLSVSCNFAFPGSTNQSISTSDDKSAFEPTNADATKDETQDCDALWKEGLREDAMQCYEGRDGLSLDMLPALASDENIPLPLKELLSECKAKSRNLEKCLQSNSKNNADAERNKVDGGNELGKIPVDALEN